MTAGSWLIASVYIDLMKHRSSATFARCGISSLTHAPDSPCCWNLNSDGATGKLACAERHAGEPLPPRMESGSSVVGKVLQAAACSRTGPSATARRTGTG